MVANTLLDLIKSHKVTDYQGLEDIGDKISFQISVIIYIICGVIVTSKTYILKPLSCYTAISPTGSNFDGYLRNYCWITGTVPWVPGDKFPQVGDDMKLDDSLKKINYYQWVPFVLALQCIMFYLPRLFWQLMSYNKIGIDLELIFKDASSASNDDEAAKKKKAKGIAKNLANVFFFHRDYKYGTWANFRRKIFKFASFFMMSKRLGTWLTYWYFVMKLMFLANAVGQLYLIQRFLGFHGNNIFETSRVFFDSLVNGVQWTTSRLFPRVTVCSIDNIKLLGVENNYITQCVLSQNMLNEKIYMFLWFWLHIVIVVTLITIGLWCKKIIFLGSRAEFIKKFLKNHEVYRKSKRDSLDNFIQTFLRHDGSFIIMMMTMNCGDLITSHVVSELWEIYQSEYANSDTSSEKDPQLLKIYPNISSDFSEPMKNIDFI